MIVVIIIIIVCVIIVIVIKCRPKCKFVFLGLRWQPAASPIINWVGPLV